MQISRDELRAAIDEVHKRGFKITGHLCSVTYAEAAELGIDNLEHGFVAATDFVSDKQPDVCPGQGRGQQTVAALDENGEPFKALVKKLIDRRVALTSTLTVFETFTPGRPVPPGVDVLLPQLKEQFLQNARADRGQPAVDLSHALPESARARARVRRRQAARSSPAPIRPAAAASSPATPISGSSSCSWKPDSARSRRSPLARPTARSILGRDARVGTIAVGKQADLVVVNGDPSTNIADVRKVEIVFKQGVGFDPAKLIESVKGRQASGKAVDATR